MSTLKLSALQTIRKQDDKLRPLDLMLAVSYWSRKVSKANRREQTSELPLFLRKLLYVVLAVANHYNFELYMAVSRKYPGCCFCCGCKPCSCRKGKRPPNLKQLPLLPITDLSVEEFQVMFKEIYPETLIWRIIAHCLEEASELACEITKKEAIGGSIEGIASEAADIFEKICDVASTVGLSLTELVLDSLHESFEIPTE